MANPVKRIGFFVYGIVAYVLFLCTFLYAIGFVGDFWQALGWSSPLLHSMDYGGPRAPVGEALVIDALLLGLFGLQHSVMARAGFKRVWTRIVPEPIERSTYVLATCACLALLFFEWRPIGTTVLWDVTDGALKWPLVGLSLFGYAIVLLSTILIDHFNLFGVRQVWNALRGRAAQPAQFRTPLLYRAVRHPLYLGFVIAFWATPLMTLSHLVFAVATTAYILVAIQLEERDLVAHFGNVYREYRRRVRMILPLPWSKD